MKISVDWLNEYVDLKDIDVKQIAHELTMSGLEVEEVEEVEEEVEETESEEPKNFFAKRVSTLVGGLAIGGVTLVFLLIILIMWLAN